MTTIGVCEYTPWRVDALWFPSYAYPYPSFKHAQLDACLELSTSRPPPLFRRLDADRMRSYEECRRLEATATPGTTKRELDALDWARGRGERAPLRPFPPARPADPAPDIIKTPKLNPKEHARWRFETTPLITTNSRSDWSGFLNRCPERFNIALPVEISGNGTLPYYDGGYALRYLRPDLTRGLGMERWSERPLGYIQGPADRSPYRAIKVNNALAGL